MSASVNATGSRTAPSVTRAFRILECLSRDPAGSWTLAELRRELGYSQGNLHAILNSLEAGGYVRRHSVHRSYSLGPALLPLGGATRRGYPLVEVALPHLELLADELSAECSASMAVGDDLLVVARIGPTAPAGTGVLLGQRFPLVPPMGSVHVAWASSAEIAAYLDAAPDLSAEDRRSLRVALRQIREQGYSLHRRWRNGQQVSETARDIIRTETVEARREELKALVTEINHQHYLLAGENGEDFAGLLSVSAPVFTAAGHVALALSVSLTGPTVASTPLSDIISRLVATAQNVTSAARRSGIDFGQE